VNEIRDGIQFRFSYRPTRVAIQTALSQTLLTSLASMFIHCWQIYYFSFKLLFHPANIRSYSLIDIQLSLLAYNVKGKKPSRYTPWRRWGGEEYNSYSFLTSALDGGEWSASRPGRAFTPGEWTPGLHCTGGWVGPRAGLDTKARGKILCPCRGLNPGRPVVQTIVRHYTDWANPAFYRLKNKLHNFLHKVTYL
jgi:hypothetical protein